MRDEKWGPLNEVVFPSKKWGYSVEDLTSMGVLGGGLKHVLLIFLNFAPT